MKHPIQISFFDVTTSCMSNLMTFDNIVGTGENATYDFIAIPRKGDIVNFASYDERNEPHQNYKVIEVKYSYKELFKPEFVFTFIQVYVKKV